MNNKCQGKNCTSTDGRNHSVDCLFAHFTAYTSAHKETVEVKAKLKKAYFDGHEAGLAQADGLETAINDRDACLARLEQAEKVIDELVEHIDAIRLAVEPYDDIKPRDWKSDRSNLRDAHQCCKEALASAKLFKEGTWC